ncbi:hypothetical protein CSC94_16345 [Zhengella mangrovi]|uniref:Lipid II flippase Amj n=2 Tax=Zhengella mangrovi TaxID=1982044 RepID=A0A2G1QK74_9HYPH|nr:hypothetical protein CSC94_16345 [Zhengella mangrovi]
MDVQLVFVLAFTFVIHLVGTLAFAFRIAGVRTGQIAVAFSLFNILVLISRTANSFQGPLLAKRVETAIGSRLTASLDFDFLLILMMASVATLVGGLLIPTFQRLSSIAVSNFGQHRSLFRLICRSLTPRGVSILTESVSLPRYSSVAATSLGMKAPFSIILMNFFATALWTVGGLAAIYAGTLQPEFRVTSSSLSAVINGVATILLFTAVDPFLAGMTDDVVKGRETEARFRQVVVWMVLSRFAGTAVAPVLLWPAAHLIASISTWI